MGCFVEGKCANSQYLDVTSTPGGELECLNYCASVEGSNYFSYDSGSFVSIAYLIISRWRNNHMNTLNCSFVSASEIVVH